MHHEIFYDAGPVITKAWLVGFCVKEDTPKTCKHMACGYREPYRVCPKCGNEQEESNFHIHCTQWFGSHTGPQECGGRYDQSPVQGGIPVKCNRVKYIGLNLKQLCNPEQPVRYAAVKIELAGESDWHLFVIDLETQEFINEEMSIHYFGKGSESWSVGTTVRIRNIADLNKIVNKPQVFDAIANVISK